MNRAQYARRNIIFGYLGNIVAAILGFVLRTVFIYKLDKSYLGVNGLYSNLLSVLSLADLGMTSAINYSLYGPVAREEYGKVAAYMALFKKTYHYIALAVTAVGVAFIPFLQYIIKDAGNIPLSNLQLYYVMFLFNTVSSYFVAYKYNLANAQQRGYIQTNITTITKLITVLLQIVVLLVWENFTLYLATQIVVELVQKIFANFYLNRTYPFLKSHTDEKLSREEKGEIVRNVKALLLHRIGDALRLQTDNIIISAFMSVALVGMVDNYVLVITTVSGFVNILFYSVMGSLGNVIAIESKEKQYLVFRTYRFLGAWIYGFSTVGYMLLLTPLIFLLWGEQFALPVIAIALMLIDYYLKGLRIVLTNYKTAAGIFQEDQYVALIQGVVNLIISIVLVQKMGLAGIYIGTVVSGLIANIQKPILIYKKCFSVPVREYFFSSLKYIVTLLISLVICYGAGHAMNLSEGWGGFFFMAFLITIVFNGCFILAFYRKPEFTYLLSILQRMLKQKQKG